MVGLVSEYQAIVFKQAVQHLVSAFGHAQRATLYRDKRGFEQFGRALVFVILPGILKHQIVLFAFFFIVTATLTNLSISKVTPEYSGIQAA